MLILKTMLLQLQKKWRQAQIPLGGLEISKKGVSPKRGRGNFEKGGQKLLPSML